MSIFDPVTFEQTSFDGALDTEFTPIPIGDWLCETTGIKLEPWQGKKDPSLSGGKAILSLNMIDPEALSKMGRDKAIPTRYEVMLNLTPEGNLDMGKGQNIRLGRLRAACGLNQPGVPFRFEQLVGHLLRVSFEHEDYNGAPQARAKAVARA